MFDVVVRSLFDGDIFRPRGANVRTEDMLAAPWGAESADFAGVEAKQWLVVCFCKLASTVWALFFSSIGGWFPAETASSGPPPFSWLSGHEGVLAAVGASLESDEPAVVHGAVDQRGGHVLVAEHASPAGELDVRGVDHAPGLVGIRYDLEQEPGPPRRSACSRTRR